MINLEEISTVVKEKESYEKTLTQYASDLRARSNPDKNYEFARLRAFDKSTVDECGIFYIGDMTEMLLPSYIDKISDLGVISETNRKPIFKNRWVIPIRNQAGLVQNFVGYTPNADERYIYGTSKYYRRRDTYYGMENLKLAYDMGYAFITEGITDTIRLRDMGFKNSFAMCGTNVSSQMIDTLNRCRYGVILIPDRDEAGIRAHKRWKFKRSVTLFINLQYKDVDELCVEFKDDGHREKSVANIEWFKEYADICVNWVLQEKHNGQSCTCESITML
jgi:DNA primase